MAEICNRAGIDPEFAALRDALKRGILYKKMLTPYSTGMAKWAATHSKTSVPEIRQAMDFVNEANLTEFIDQCGDIHTAASILDLSVDEIDDILEG